MIEVIYALVGLAVGLWIGAAIEGRFYRRKLVQARLSLAAALRENYRYRKFSEGDPCYTDPALRSTP